VCVHGVDGRVLVTRLDLDGLEASAGSACASGSLEPSHVLLAMGCTRDDARAGLRLSLGRETTEDDVRAGVEILRKNFSDDVSPEVSRLPAELA
jgi:cysteine desulfurase